MLHSSFPESSRSSNENEEIERNFAMVFALLDEKNIPTYVLNNTIPNYIETRKLVV